jgi:phosphodiesterase/alkaline phosphatase D-like protein
MLRLFCAFAALVAVFYLLPAVSLAQVVTHGPIFGGVTENSVNVYIRTSEAASGTLTFANKSQAQIPYVVAFRTDALRDTSTVVTVRGLLPNSDYTVAVSLNGQAARYGYTIPESVRGFHTAPKVGTAENFSFAFSSCQGRNAPYEMPIYRKMLGQRPRFLLQVGDWGYPDTTDRAPDASRVFPSRYDWVQRSYRARYSMGEMRELLARTAVDYVYDDHDYMNENAGGSTCTIWYDKHLPVSEAPLPPQARPNSLRGYRENFPHYPLPDSLNAIYHSFTYGNCEYFVVDTRSQRSPNSEGISRVGEKISYKMPEGHRLLGERQYQWLLNGLQNSKATWKFIVTGISFNLGTRHTLDTLLKLPKAMLKVAGLNIFDADRLAAATLDSWVGFPNDAQGLMNMLREKDLRNVLVLSGDTHIAAIDDGANGGIPEMMSGGITETSLLLNILARIVRTNSWNGGGQGIGNWHHRPTYGQVQVYGNDSVRLAIVDDRDHTVSARTIYAGHPAAPASVLDGPEKTRVRLTFRPELNTRKGQTQLRLRFQKYTHKWGRGTKLHIYSAQGAALASYPLTIHGKRTQPIPLDALQAGNPYFLVVRGPYGQSAYCWRRP